MESETQGKYVDAKAMLRKIRALILIQVEDLEAEALKA